MAVSKKLSEWFEINNNAVTKAWKAIRQKFPKAEQWRCVALAESVCWCPGYLKGASDKAFLLQRNGQVMLLNSEGRHAVATGITNSPQFDYVDLSASIEATLLAEAEDKKLMEAFGRDQSALLEFDGWYKAFVLEAIADLHSAAQE